jgi:sec-independent protein translocase protein TatA
MFNGSKDLLILVGVLVIVLVIFGPKQLPKLGKMIGGSMKSVRDGMEGNYSDDEDETPKPKAVEAATATDAPAKKPVAKDTEAI